MIFFRFGLRDEQDIAAVNDEAELVGVRYYIRLILEDGAQQAYWHTHEIFFHR